MRGSKTQYAGIFQSLEVYYQALSAPAEQSDKTWQAHLDRLEHWKKARPDSPTPLIALGSAWDDLACSARGSDVASKVPEKAWNMYNDRIKKAAEYIDAAVMLKPADPAAYARLIDLAGARGWSREKVFAALEKGIKIDPRFFLLYRSMAFYLLPQWYGDPGDVQRFAAEMRQRFGAGLGDDIYFRVTCREAMYLGDGLFSGGDYRYEELLPGIQVMLRDYPESEYYFNFACRMASLAGDNDVAALLFDRIDAATYWPMVLGGLRRRVEHWRRIVDPSSHEGEDLLTLQGENGWVRGVAFLNDNKRLLSAGYLQQASTFGTFADK